MKCLVLLCLVAGALAGPLDCPKNQYYTSCAPACPQTCDNYQNPPKACVLTCVRGCTCSAGFVKTDEGECVKPEQCPSKTETCPANSHYKPCGTACPLTCDNYQNPPEFCVKMCVAGCHCDKGYVKNKQGQCVRTDQCPSKSDDTCGENESFHECGTACPLTCENVNNPPRICPAMCKIGCQCDQGYVRAADGRCVAPENCPGRVEEKSCLGRPETGMCRAFFPMWHYSIQDGKCHKFVYGGCGGNGNRYASEEECMQHCEGYRLRQSTNDICELPAEPGMCMAYFPRYYFNKNSGKCEKFVYGGCAGNANNFRTIEECQSACAQ